LELEVPTSSSIRSMGLRPSIYVDAGSVWSLTQPELTDIIAVCSPTAANPDKTTKFVLPGGSPNCPGLTTDYTRTAGIKETFLGNSPKPRLSIGFGVNWVSPFGPFRIDIAKALLKQKGDDTKLFSFNVGTQF
jgi:outer membrane protein insertion porin family